MLTSVKIFLPLAVIFCCINSGACIKNGDRARSMRGLEYTANLKMGNDRGNQRHHWSGRGSGTVIGARWILTCAHLFFETDFGSNEQHHRASYAKAVVGRLRWSENAARNALRVVVHSGYDSLRGLDGHDIALVEFGRPITKLRIVEPVQLPSDGQANLYGADCSTSGWGLTDMDEPTDNLHTAPVTVYNDIDSVWNDPLYENYNFQDKMLIVDQDAIEDDEFEPSEARAAYKGDSGAGIICHVPDYHGDEVTRVYGVVTGGPSGRFDPQYFNYLGSTSIPVIYTSVEEHLNWVNGEMGRMDRQDGFLVFSPPNQNLPPRNQVRRQSPPRNQDPRRSPPRNQVPRSNRHGRHHNEYRFRPDL